ncbi:putative transcriptional repressor NrdR [Mycobacterium xenopi 4042]|uniref:Putative transcriptional repressor NrdR n=1 Tax=Mycobacterium xenopi 4042 TaxID=1299334 RepID=X8CH16_MYCXE|nr:putative transcriptional repressor NrdR [Mycobacterium xenopi 4042]
MPGMWAALHHRGDSGAGCRQAQRRHRTVQPGKGDQRRAPGMSGPPGRRRCTESARPASRRHRARKGSPEVPSHEVGLAILGPLRELDEVAYLRFASVYRSFTSADDFEREIEALRAHRKVSAPN